MPSTEACRRRNINRHTQHIRPTNSNISSHHHHNNIIITIKVANHHHHHHLSPIPTNTIHSISSNSSSHLTVAHQVNSIRTNNHKHNSHTSHIMHRMPAAPTIAHMPVRLIVTTTIETETVQTTMA
jgi:hypothetical protein